MHDLVTSKYAHPKERIKAYRAITERHRLHLDIMFRTVLLAILIGVLWTLTGCGSTRGNLVPVQRQQSTTVLVQTPCGAGSGVIVSPTQILTARHVLGSANGGPCGSLFIISDRQGNAYAARLEIAVDVDLARLVILDGQGTLGNVTKPRVAKARGVVCFDPMWPQRGRKCGVVTTVDETHWGLKYAGELTIPGNSGSGLWDSGGRLVGIITCTHPLGGCATSLSTRKWLVP